jgi:nitroreductase/dihydropteridine reductase
MKHEIIEQLEQRYTAKRYDASKKISSSDISIILNALRLSPSSINSQPWKFIVIESDAAKQRFHNTFENKFQFNQPHAKAASHTILFAYNPNYTREDYANVVDQGIADGRTKPEDREAAFGSFLFAEINTNEKGDTSSWTKAQTYLALGNTLHTVARLGIDSTPMEGVDPEMIGKEFSNELDGFGCEVALSMGYHDDELDYNASLAKTRLTADKVIKIL